MSPCPCVYYFSRAVRTVGNIKEGSIGIFGFAVFDGFVCGFRFWPNFFAVLRFWMIFFFGFAVSNIPQCPPHKKIITTLGANHRGVLSVVEFHSMLVWVYKENECETHTVYEVLKLQVTIPAESGWCPRST